MPDPLDRLYDLLPAVHRMRDAQQGEPLRALLQVIGAQVTVIEDDIARLYDNWFIETCDDWVIPYIGALVGFEPAVDPGLAADTSTESGRARARAIFPRTDVANTVRNRRRKGTLWLLELLARDAADWPSRAVEQFRTLAWSQHVSYRHLYRGRRLDVRRGEALALIGSPFDEVAHTADVRRAASRHGAGVHNLPGVTTFVWRLAPYTVTGTKAHCVEEAGPHCFTFSVLGNDAPLFTEPQPESDPTAIARELTLPVPIRRRALEVRPEAYVPRSFQILTPGWPRRGGPVRIVAADLSDWSAYRTRRHTVAVDPVLGRIQFPHDDPPKAGVVVTYRYGFSTDMGGGEYPRALAEPAGAAVFSIGAGGHATIRDALAAWQAQPTRTDAVLEITESGVFVEPIAIDVPDRRSLTIRAASGARPVIRLIDWQTDQPDSFVINGGAGSRVVLDGLLVTGRAVRVTGALARLTIRHSTLVPGWSLDTTCAPRRPADPSLEIVSATVAVRIEHSIVGAIEVSVPPPDTYQTPAAADHADLARCGGYRADPLCVEISDSILDATRPSREALGAPGCAAAHVCLRIRRTTVFGEVHVHALELGEDAIFDGRVFVARRQVGCLRFSYVAPGSRTPRRVSCQPTATSGVAPRFSSVRYGRPDYAQLSSDCPAEIASGASDQSEMGAFHDLYQPQRAALLRARLDAAVPASMQAGLIFVN